MWGFCLRSLVQEYGWRFAWRVAARRPWQTLKALSEAGRLDVTADGAEVTGAAARVPAGGTPSIVGAGFCLKPISPPCPSGRANHDCRFLEELAAGPAAAVPVPCRPCAIREIGTQALGAGAAFYVMTSARDILEDVYVPALEARQFPTGLFVLCRYSFMPFAAGLIASGMRARLVPFVQGDCRDYRTWLRADRGIKDGQTAVDAAASADVAARLGGAPPVGPLRVVRCGNVLFPAAAAWEE